MYTKDCDGCGESFETPDSRQTRHVKDCGRTTRNTARAARNAAHDVTFIGVDGEGVTDANGDHHYVLLSVGDESLYHRDGSHLHWSEILTFLYAQYEQNPTAAFVGFYLGYDFTQWLRTLSENRGTMLFSPAGVNARRRTGSGGNPTPFPVRLEYGDDQWEVDILATRRFKLRPRRTPAAGWMYVCDSGGFWQCSFLHAIDPAGWYGDGPATEKQYGIIVEGKEARSTATFDRSMIRYNVTENRVLADMMSRLNRGFVNADLRLSKDQWFGPGQVASEWLKSVGCPTGEQVRSEVPEWALDAARKTYYGGWFEIQAHGHIPGTTYEYDINSAYPAEIAGLPCLLHGEWSRGSGPCEITPFTMVLVEMRGSDKRTGVAPHRLPKGQILRPQQSAGWMWGSELYEAVAAGLVSDFTVHEWIRYEPCDCPPPIGDIRTLYNRRIDVGKGSVTGKALKLVYNSAYGKFAQSVGSPRFANAIYASLITSGCRTRILSAITSHPTGTNSLVMVATDGIYFREPHPHLDFDHNRLGAWDATEKQNLCLLMPGVYWDDAARNRIADGKAPQFKARGISARDLASRIADLDDQFARFDGETWPTLEMSVGFAMTSCKQALHRGAWETAGQVSTGESRAISSAPAHKRVARSVARDGDVWRSRPWESVPDCPVSTPYSETFGGPVADELEGQTPDADKVADPWYWAIHGED